MKNIRLLLPSFLIVLAFIFLDNSTVWNRLIFAALGVWSLCSVAERLYNYKKGSEEK